MQTIQVTTKEANSVWRSPDGQREIFEVILDYDGKAFKAKTYSNDISVPGWVGTVDTYEKDGRNGKETFVKQPPKEGFTPGGSSGSRGGSKGSYQPKDEKAIQAMWAIGQAINLAPGQDPLQKHAMTAEERLVEVETYAQELFAMVPRVKATPVDSETATETQTEDTPVQVPADFAAPKKPDVIVTDDVSIEDLSAIMGNVTKLDEETPWNKET